MYPDGLALFGTAWQARRGQCIWSPIPRWFLLLRFWFDSSGGASHTQGAFFSLFLLRSSKIMRLLLRYPGRGENTLRRCQSTQYPLWEIRKCTN